MSVKVTFAGSGDAMGSGGRFNTCILVEAPEICFAIDFGASSLIALNALSIPHNRIDAILLTHLHADHCAGVPNLLMDAMLGAKRQTPLTVAGPAETAARMIKIADAIYPGMEVMKPKFDVETIEMDMLTPHEVRGMKVTTYPAIHTRQTNPTSIRVEVAGKIIAYTGDTAWTEHIPDLARDADLFISECYFFQKPVRFHMNYPDLKEHWDELEAKRIILTHMGPEMLEQQDEVPEECAYDGLVIEI